MSAMTTKEQINYFLTNIFNKILKIEESAIVKRGDKSLSITEFHIIEKIGKQGQERMSDVANAIGITLGSFTVAADKLEKKGYIERMRDDTDRRIVKVKLTHKGLAAYRLHEIFHSRMVDSIIKELDENEQEHLSKTLERLYNFFLKYDKQIGIK